MMYAAAYMLVQFGTGTVSVGCNIIKGPIEQWCITIHEIKDLNKPFKVGEPLIENDIMREGQSIMLTFPTERQMLNVLAAIGNQTYEEVKSKFDKALAERLAV